MSLFLSKKSPFELYFRKLTSQGVIRQNKYFKVVTAAFLYSIAEFVFACNDNEKKYEATMQDIFSFLDGTYFFRSQDEIFNKCVELFTSVILGETKPRADWCFNNKSDDNPLYNLFFCYGDLINNPEYIFDYENSPILIRDFFVQMSFAKDFTNTLLIVQKYTNDLYKH